MAAMTPLHRLPHWRGRAAWTLLTAVLWAAPAAALTPRDELLRLVPDDVGLCGILQDFRDNARTLSASPFAEQFKQSPLGQAFLNSPDMQKLLGAEKFLQDNFQIDWAHLRDDILGDAVVLAYWPGLPDREQGMIMVRARSALQLARVVSRLPEVLKKSAKANPPETRRYQGVTYWFWQEGERSHFSYLKRNIFVVTHQEALLHRVIDRDRQAPAEEEPAIARQLRLLAVDKALATLWINPRYFEPEIEQKAAQPPGPAPFALPTALAYWKAVEGIALSASLDKDGLELGLALRMAESRLPPAARKVLAAERRPSELWRCFSDNAMLTVVGRVDPAGLVEVGNSFLNEPARKAFRELVERNLNPVFGRDVFQGVLPFLGPDWGFCVAAPPDAQTLVPDVVAALRVRSDGKEPSVEASLRSALNTFAVLGVVTYNNLHPDQLLLQTTMQDKVEVKYLTNENCFPAGLQPAFAVKDGYLLLASSPEAIRRFRVPPAAGGGAPGAEIPLVRFSARALAGYLKDRHAVLAGHIAAKDGVSKEEAGRRLDGLLAALALFDRLEVSQQVSPSRLAWTVRMRTAWPLK
jgi:hypothetical protein